MCNLAPSLTLKIKAKMENQSKIQVTQLEYDLLHRIMNCENDGVGMGYSEFDGKGISNVEKGVLSSLIKKELVYDSWEDYIEEEDYNPMYCTTQLRDNILLEPKVIKKVHISYSEDYGHKGIRAWLVQKSYNGQIDGDSNSHIVYKRENFNLIFEHIQEWIKDGFEVEIKENK